ncbi:hypothetical protein [Nostoc commune]|uniref:hypothetical protein n=1 Tax=Nostoc commune TaxID=1178 RepID=UPI0018C5762E|nr:hypothetical protein [Nostoc commune]MBG1261809.1 hypothetical protein [Nostoc commune BAE]
MWLRKLREAGGLWWNCFAVGFCSSKVERSHLLLRDFQQINYPILWGGHLARLWLRAGETPTPQEVIKYFFV